MKRACRLLMVAAVLLLGFSACSDNDDPQGIVKVFKYDGSLQCDLDSGVPLEEHAQVLRTAGIDVICQQKGNDGMPHNGACGSETGGINIYSIHAASLPDARALEFAPVRELPDYRDSECVPAV